jgi:hypothetical protein
VALSPGTPNELLYSVAANADLTANVRQRDVARMLAVCERAWWLFHWKSRAWRTIIVLVGALHRTAHTSLSRYDHSVKLTKRGMIVDGAVEKSVPWWLVIREIGTDKGNRSIVVGRFAEIYTNRQILTYLSSC